MGRHGKRRSKCKTVFGRLKSDYRYSNEIVYNNYPFSQVMAGSISNDKKIREAYSRFIFKNKTKKNKELEKRRLKTLNIVQAVVAFNIQNNDYKQNFGNSLF